MKPCCKSYHDGLPEKFRYIKADDYCSCPCHQMKSKIQAILDDCVLYDIEAERKSQHCEAMDFALLKRKLGAFADTELNPYRLTTSLLQEVLQDDLSEIWYERTPLEKQRRIDAIINELNWLQQK